MQRGVAKFSQLKKILIRRDNALHAFSLSRFSFLCFSASKQERNSRQESAPTSRTARSFVVQQLANEEKRATKKVQTALASESIHLRSFFFLH